MSKLKLTYRFSTEDKFDMEEFNRLNKSGDMAIALFQMAYNDMPLKEALETYNINIDELTS